MSGNCHGWKLSVWELSREEIVSDIVRENFLDRNCPRGVDHREIVCVEIVRSELSSHINSVTSKTHCVETTGLRSSCSSTWLLLLC